MQVVRGRILPRIFRFCVHVVDIRLVFSIHTMFTMFIISANAQIRSEKNKDDSFFETKTKRNENNSPNEL